MAEALKTKVPSELRWRGKDIDITTVVRELVRLWSELSDDGSVVHPIRTHIFNLLVCAPDHATADAICQKLEELSERQPSRAVILVSDRLQPTTSLNAEVKVQCQTDGQLPLCQERIKLEAHGKVADHLGSIVLPLLVAELPTYLWWPGQPPFGHQVFHRLLSVADQLVLDSAQFTSPGDGFANIARLCSGEHGVTDFNWARLNAWREIIARFFDPPALRPLARGIRSVHMQFGSGGKDFGRMTSGILLMLGWMASRLGWEPETTLDELATRDVTVALLQGERLIPVDIGFHDHGRRAASRLMRIEAESESDTGQAGKFTVERTDDLEHARVTMKLKEEPPVTRVVPLGIRSDAELLVDELEQSGHDLLYEEVIQMAARIGGREMWQAK